MIFRYKCNYLIKIIYKQELPYYAQRLHLGSGTIGPSTARHLGSGGPPRRVRAALEEAKGVPHPSPTRGHPALRLIEINPAGNSFFLNIHTLIVTHLIQLIF